jgi:hypothetical protein
VIPRDAGGLMGLALLAAPLWPATAAAVIVCDRAWAVGAWIWRSQAMLRRPQTPANQGGGRWHA